MNFSLVIYEVELEITCSLVGGCDKISSSESADAFPSSLESRSDHSDVDSSKLVGIEWGLQKKGLFGCTPLKVW